MNAYYNPVRLYWGKHCVTHIKECIDSLSVKRVMILKWSENALKDGPGDALYQALSNCQISELTFEKSNPDICELYDLYQNEKNRPPQLIVAIGGGSVLDMAKSLAAILDGNYASVDELRNAICKKTTGTPHCHWIGIPTTAGTGSEVTCWATVWDKEKDAKLSLENKANYAYAAFVEPECMMSMPMKLAVSSALDAVAHATESYWAKAHNMVSDIYALKAISMIMTDLERLIDAPKEEYFLSMAEASMLAGRAFSNTKTTACHSISYPLTLRYGIPHGIAVSMLLPSLLVVNEKEIHDKEALLAAYGASDVQTAGERIHKLLQKAGISDRLSDWGVQESELPSVAARCFTKGRMENNPVDLQEEDVLRILTGIL